MLPPLCIDCSLALPHAPTGLIVIRGISGRAGRSPRENARVDGFQRHHWSWQESLLSSAWPFLVVALIPGISLASIGVTSHFRSGWLKPSIVAGLVALAVPAVFFVLGARKKMDGEGWAFLLIMPGLAEELVFRGVYQSLLNRVFGKPWRLANAEFGWGLFITAILFAGFNGLVSWIPNSMLASFSRRLSARLW